MFRFLLRLTCALAALSKGAEVESCTATFDGSKLTISNSYIEQSWLADGNTLRTTSLRDVRTNVQWAKPEPTSASPEKYVLSKRWVQDAVERRSLVVELSRAGAPQGGFRFRIFSDSSAISVSRIGSPSGSVAAVTKTDDRAAPTGIETEKSSGSSRDADYSTAIENLALKPQHLRLTEVDLFDQTDIHNELVFERPRLLQANESLRLQGNLFLLEDALTRNGLIFLKEAPLPHARPQKSDVDLLFDSPHQLLAFPDSSVGPNGTGYRLTTLVYSGGAAGVTRALQAYQRQVRPYVAGRDGMFLSNTWGDRSRDARINEAFLQSEIAAGARLGVDVVQVDDGWEHGVTKNSARSGGVWNGFWAFDPNFWDENRERFPHGLKPVIESARQRGMGFGLWFAPDSSNDFANWERDAARLLEIHRTLGVNYFKIDGVKATSKLSEERLHALFERVLNESAGKVVFDLDVTAEIRPGYFGVMNNGPLFVENRYTDRHGYYPHLTLRNLWSLARYVDPMRLRMEFLNNARHQDLYAGDPLAPAEYLPDYLFATTMMANPLGWFEASNLPAAYFERVKPLVDVWKRERGKMQGGFILPIGSAPDGVAWTGFLSTGEKAGEGYLLAFRERNGQSRWSALVPITLGPKPQLELLAGEGKGRIRDGRMEIDIPHELRFAWFKIRSTH